MNPKIELITGEGDLDKCDCCGKYSDRSIFFSFEKKGALICGECIGLAVKVLFTMPGCEKGV